MHRIRTHTRHRGWTARQRTPEAMAKDIAISIQAKQQAGITTTVTDYTVNPTTIQVVTALLHKAA